MPSIASSRKKATSRGCTAVRLVPCMESFIGGFRESCMALVDFALYLGARAAELRAHAFHEICSVCLRIVKVVGDHFLPALRAGFHDEVPLRQVLEPFGE